MYNYDITSHNEFQIFKYDITKNLTITFTIFNKKYNYVMPFKHSQNN